MAEKKSTPFYHSWLRNLERLAGKDKGVCCDLMLSLLRHGATGDGLEIDSDNPLSFSAELLFEEYSETIDRDTEKYFKKCEQNRANASERKRSQAVASGRKVLDTDIDIDIDKDIDIGIETTGLKRPTKRTKFHNCDERQYSDEQMKNIEEKLIGG